VPIWRGGRSRGRQQFVHKLWAAFCQPEVMSELTPEEVVRRYWAEFGPTYNDAVASSRRWLHEDVNLVSFGSRIENLDALLADLEQARDKMGIHGYRVYMRNVAANGPISVTTRRRILEWAAVPPGRHREPDHRRHVRCRRRLKTETVSTRRFGVNFRPPLTFITGLVIGDLVGHLPLPLGVARPRGLHRDRPASTASVCSATPPGTEPTPPAIRRRLSSRPTTSRTSPGSQAGHAQATRTRTTDYSGTDRVCSGSSAPETEAA
jgi:hypothetical protein